MAHLFVLDYCPTPRGRGRSGGALPQVPPVHVATPMLGALRGRNELDTQRVENVVFGCVKPIGEQDAVAPRIAARCAGYAEGVSGVQASRFPASGIEAANLASAKVMAVQGKLVVASGVESISRAPMSFDGGARAAGPRDAKLGWYRPQGVWVDLLPIIDGCESEAPKPDATQSQRRAHRLRLGLRSRASPVPVCDVMGAEPLIEEQFPRLEVLLSDLTKGNLPYEKPGDELGYDAVVVLQRHPTFERIQYFNARGTSSDIADAAGEISCVRVFGRRGHHCIDGPERFDAPGPAAGWNMPGIRRLVRNPGGG